MSMISSQFTAQSFIKVLSTIITSTTAPNHIITATSTYVTTPTLTQRPSLP